MSGGIVARLTTLGLADWPETVALTTADVAALLTTAPHEGVVSLLGAAVDLGRVTIDGPCDEQVAAAWTEAMAGVVQLDGLLVQVVQTLTAAGLECRVLKGAAIAMLDEVDPAWRSYHDVDVLVPEPSLLAAVDVLGGLGLRPVIAPVSRRWAARHAKSITLVHTNGLQVDVHRALTPGVFGDRIRPASLFEEGERFEVGGVAVQALGAPHRFLHACYHAALGGARGARHRRDVLLLSRRVRVDATPAQWSFGWSPTVVAAALDWAVEDGAPLPADWRQWRADLVVDPDDTALLHTYTGQFREQAIASVRSADGLLARLRYSWPLLWPSRAHLRDRGTSRVQHLRAALSVRRRTNGSVSGR